MTGLTESYAQSITYSIPLRDNIRSTSFDIIGKCGDHLMIYKKSFSEQVMVLYDHHMKILDMVPLKFLPADVKGTSFINLGNKVMVIYQYMHRRNIYCDAVLLDQDAQPLTEPLRISKTIHPDRIVGNEAYATLSSQNKNNIMVYEVLRDEDALNFHLRTFLLDTAMRLTTTAQITIPYLQDSDRLSNFTLSNAGNLYFTFASKTYSLNDYYQKLWLYCSTVAHGLYKDSIPLNGHLPRDPALLELDESHDRVWLTTLNYDSKQRDIDYLFTARYRMDDISLIDAKTIPLTDSVKGVLASKRVNRSHALNQYVLTGQVTDKQGNVLLTGEERFQDGKGVNQYDNLLLMNLDSTGNLLQVQKIPKEQGEDLTDIFSSYLMINTGDALHFLMNKSHRIFRFLNNYVYLLSDYRYGADHRIEEMPVMRGLDNKTRWAPRYGVQTSRTEVVIPCVIGSSLLFGKITYR